MIISYLSAFRFDRFENRRTTSDKPKIIFRKSGIEVHRVR